MILHFLKKYLYLLLISWGIFLSAQYHIPEKLKVLYPIYDEVGVLSEQDKKRLNDKLIKYEDSTSTEIEVIIIPSTKGEDINFLATKFGQKWKIGKKNVDNGVVFLIATQDKTLSIQQGRAVEQYLTASVSGQIIDYLVIPHLKKGDWYKAIDEGTNAIMEATQGKFKPKKKNAENENNGGLLIIVVIFVVIFIIIVYSNKNGGDKGGKWFDYDDIVISRKGKRNYPGSFVFPSFGGSSGGFGSSGGGGFGGFGGGGTFGGGGASGSWMDSDIDL